MRNSECGREGKIMPKVTVLMPVYNAGKFLREAVDSILRQSFTGFEFLIIDDGSTDDSQSIIRSYDDSRIRFVQNESNLGVALTLNKGLSLAQGQYIARMDGDDVSEPERLYKQVDFLENKKKLGLCGSWILNFNSKVRYVDRFPVGEDCIKASIILRNPIAHPTVMMRTEMFRKHGLEYDPNCLAAQDYELWARCVNYFPIDNIQEPLLRFRINEGGITHTRFKDANKHALFIQHHELNKLGIEVTDQELHFHRDVGNGSGVCSLEELKKAMEWLLRLISVNDRTQIYSYEGLLKAVASSWFRMNLNSSGIGLGVIRQYRKPFFRSYCKPSRREMIHFFVNALLRINKTPTGQLLGSS